MKKQRRALCLLLALLMIPSLVGCGGKNEPPRETDTPAMPAPAQETETPEPADRRLPSPPPTEEPGGEEQPAAPEAALEDTCWRAAYYVTKDPGGSVQQDPSGFWNVELFLYADGRALLRDDHFAELYEREYTWSVSGDLLVLSAEEGDLRHEGSLIRVNGTTRLLLRLNEYGEYNMVSEPMPEKVEASPEARMQELVGSWDLVSGISEGWSWTAEEADQNEQLTIEMSGGVLKLLRVRSGVSEPEMTLTFIEAQTMEWGETVPWHMETPEYETKHGSTEQMELTLLDDGTLRAKRTYFFDGYPAASIQYYWRDGVRVDEAAAAAAVAEIVEQTQPEGLLSIWSCPDVRHPCSDAWAELGLTPTILVGIAPGITVTVKEGAPIYDARNGTEIVGWEEYYPVYGPVTLQRGEYVYVALGFPRYEGEEAHQYLEMEKDGEVWFWSAGRYAGPEPGGWLPLL